MKNEKPHIGSILKQGATLKAETLDEKDARINALIQKTIAEQEKVLALKKIKPEVWQQVITI